VPSGPGIRDDGGVYEGWEVPIYYDPMISKLVAWGATRGEAIARLQRALGEYHIGGIRTTIPFFKAVLQDDEFRRGEIDTAFVTRFLERRIATKAATDEDALSEEQLAAAFAAALSYNGRQAQADNSPSSVTRADRWKMAGRMAGLNRRR